MKCKACNKTLSDFEATRKTKDTQEYLDLCNKCYRPISENVQVVERWDLASNQDFEDDECDASDTNDVPAVLPWEEIGEETT